MLKSKARDIVNQIQEAIDPAVQSLVDKYGLTIDKSGTWVNDFNYSDEVGNDFSAAGYLIRWDSSKNKFKVMSFKDIEAANKADDLAALQKARAAMKPLGNMPAFGNKN